VTTWIVVGFVAAGSYLLRASMLVVIGRSGAPWWLDRALDRALPLAAPAVVAALVAPALLTPDGAESGRHLLAVAAAGFVAWRTRSIPLTLLTGLGLATLGALL
jgi:branched-subunit amino acid transport protein